MNLSRPMSEILAVVTTLMVLALMAAAAAAPLLQSSWMASKIVEDRLTLEQLRARTGKEAGLRKDNESLVASDQAASLLLEGETTGIAGANLQKLMNDIVLNHGGKASSLQILRPTEDSELMRIGMSLSISVDIDGLRAIVHTIESGSPLIFIEDISVKSDQGDFTAPDPTFIGPLDVTLQVSAYAVKKGVPE